MLRSFWDTPYHIPLARPPFVGKLTLYKKIEKKRNRPLIVYVTSSRKNMDASISRDVVSEVLLQLQKLPSKCKELDFLLVSNGGDGTVAWRIVSLIRERVERFSVLVPQAAFSAATLIALGADEIVMHSYGNLGPTDPQITNRNKNVQFGSEDLTAFLKFAREEVGLTDQAPLLELFKSFSMEVGFVGIGVAARSSQLAVSMGEKLLRLHMKSDNQTQKAKVISEALNSKFFHHGYPLSRTEAREIGLPLADSDPEVESLMWQAWLDIEEELKLREPFLPVRLLKESPACAALFGPPTADGSPVISPPVEFKLIGGIMESVRLASHFIYEGTIIALRQPDLNLKMNVIPHKEGWINLPLPPAAITPKRENGKPKSRGKRSKN